MQVTHSAECIKGTTERNKLRQDYDVKYPNHCKYCEGMGGAYSSYDPSPSGVSLGSGSFVDFDPCPHCSEKGICPQCGDKLPLYVDEEGITEDVDYDKPCVTCGWREGKSQGKPPEYECWCGYND